jgi:hypothetical protein
MMTMMWLTIEYRACDNNGGCTKYGYDLMYDE